MRKIQFASAFLVLQKLARPGIQEYINEIHRKQAAREERLGNQPCLLLTGTICPLHLEQHGKKDYGLFYHRVLQTNYLQHIYTETGLQYVFIIIWNGVIKQNCYKTSEWDFLPRTSLSPAETICLNK